MAYPHRIRLRGPWECEPLTRTEASPLPLRRTMTMPCRWAEGGLGDFAGRVRFRRRFGFPGRLDAFERVWLTFGGADSTAEVWLNGHCLGRHEGGAEPFEFEVTSRLAVRNELIVDVEGPAGRGGLWGEVALEVRCSAFLRAVRLWGSFAGEHALLHVAGQIIGTSDRPLELYVLLDGRTVGYTTLEATPSGQWFQLDSDAIENARWQGGGKGEAEEMHEVQVDLVNGATVWHTLVQAFAFRPNENPS